MNHICAEITTFSRVCERLLSKERMLTDDERSLLEYYVSELSREFFSDKQTSLGLPPSDEKSPFV
jgi:hypothetical protein